MRLLSKKKMNESEYEEFYHSLWVRWSRISGINMRLLIFIRNKEEINKQELIQKNKELLNQANNNIILKEKKKKIIEKMNESDNEEFYHTVC